MDNVIPKIEMDTLKRETIDATNITRLELTLRSGDKVIIEPAVDGGIRVSKMGRPASNMTIEPEFGNIIVLS